MKFKITREEFWDLYRRITDTTPDPLILEGEAVEEKSCKFCIHKINLNSCICECHQPSEKIEELNILFSGESEKYWQPMVDKINELVRHLTRLEKRVECIYGKEMFSVQNDESIGVRLPKKQEV